jgi:hypothetical protein
MTKRRPGQLLTGMCVAVFVTAIASGCGSQLSADSSCSDYLDASQQDQHEAVNRLVKDLHADPSLTTPLGFPEVAYECGTDPDNKLGTIIKGING